MTPTSAVHRNPRAAALDETLQSWRRQWKAATTAAAMANGVPAIYEATLANAEMVVQAEMLERNGAGWICGSEVEPWS